MRIGLGVVAAAALAIACLAGSPHAAANASVRRSTPQARASTPITIGHVDFLGNPGPSCSSPPRTGVEQAAPIYVVPSAGVVTSFSYRASSFAGQVRVLFAVPGQSPGHLTIVAKSPLQTVVPDIVDTFPVRVPVQPGQLLGMEATTAVMACTYQGGSTDVASGAAPFDPDVSSDLLLSSNLVGVRWNVSAALEPDTDGDGYGDLTQDACPEAAGFSAACPTPVTDVAKRPGRTTRHRRVKVRFSSSVPGSTFACSLDGGRFRPCVSPYERRLALGKHTILLQATSPAGIVEPSPARVRFRILPPKRH